MNFSVLLSAASVPPHTPGAEHTLCTFQDIQERRMWFPLNDDVMGGVSVGKITFTDDNTMVFSGQVSLENRGGFASIRSQTKHQNLKEVKEFKLRVKGDGQQYYFNISSSNFIADPGYQVRFKTQKDVWEIITISVSDFEAAFGSNYDNTNLVMSDIKLMGLIISDRQAGTFRLEIDWIKAV